MYHISILATHQDEDDFGERLGDIADVAYCPVTNEEEMAERLENCCYKPFIKHIYYRYAF